MPDLDQVLAPPSATPASSEILEGVLVLRGGERWARVDDRAALLGPVVGGENADDGDTVCLAIAQTGTPFVIYP